MGALDTKWLGTIKELRRSELNSNFNLAHLLERKHYFCGKIVTDISTRIFYNLTWHAC